MHDTLQSMLVVLTVTNRTRILVVGRELKRWSNRLWRWTEDKVESRP